MRRPKLLLRILFILCISTILIASHFNFFMHQMSAGLAVLSGIILSLVFTNPFETLTKKLSAKLLAWSVIGLGFGINLMTVVKVGTHGIGYTFFGIVLCSILGLSLGKWLNNKRDTSVLITFGTAICGGSAIAAISPVIRAQRHETSVALAVVFILNAISLFIFPSVGHYLHLSQEQFGLWSALAIQDTSSVVGASMQYGPYALNIGTTVKLARALWIVPLTFMISIYYSRCLFNKTESSLQTTLKAPGFILGFLLAAALVTWVPSCRALGLHIRSIAEQALVITLFCIGANLSRSDIKIVGIKPFVQGILLWIVMAGVTLSAIYFRYLSLSLT